MLELRLTGVPGQMSDGPLQGTQSHGDCDGAYTHNSQLTWLSTPLTHLAAAQ